MIKVYDKPTVKQAPYTIENDKYGVLNDFFQVLMKNDNIDSLDLFFNNLQTLKMKPSTVEDMSSPSTLAEYSVNFNYIRFIPEVFKYAISHELLHVASSFLGTECQYSGFSQFSKKDEILLGVGLNEGYTALLDDRYFYDYIPNKQEYLHNTYQIIKSIASSLEDLVGRENMEKWYFEADLKSLVEYLNQFMEYDDCICFLLSTDNLFYYCDEGMQFKPFVTITNYKYAIEFIGRCYINIFSQKLVDGEITQNKFNELMGYVHQIMSREIKFGIIKSRKMSKRKFMKIVTTEQNKVLKKYI